MKSLILMLGALAVVSACSGRADRRTPPADDLTLPAELARTDSSIPVSPVEEPVAKAAEKTTSESRPEARRRKRKAPPSVADTASAQGYAPHASLDSTRVADTAATATPDTAVLSAAESTPAATTDSATTPPDTLAVRASDTASTSSVHDTTVARGAVSAAASPGTAAGRTLPVGTEIRVALDDSINSRHDSVGRIVSAHVMENVTAPGGDTLIAAGAPVRLTITKLGPAKSKSASSGRLAFRVDGIAIGGQLQRVKADVRPVPHELRGRGVTTGDAAKVGVGAAGGAVLGRVIGGNTRGAVIGGVVGAVGGAVVASQTASRDVVVQAKTPVTFVLTEPLVAH